jgi:inosine/xanthosine triphosphate pyrophosphatase family protein
MESVLTKHSRLGGIVFATGNAGKLDEVREILAQGEAIDIESRDIDRKPYSTSPSVGQLPNLRQYRKSRERRRR